jgi:hypothetical protein
MNDLNRGAVTPLAYRCMAGVAGLIGAAASVVAIRFFMVSVQSQESDPAIRAVLTFTAVLFVVAEVGLFSLAGLLTRAKHKALRTRLVLAGCVLLAFEVASIFGAQVVIAAGDDARAQATQTRITELKATIDRQRKTATALVEAGRVSGQSVIAASRQSGLAALEKASDLETTTLALSSELARLEAAKVPTQTGIFGEVGTVVMGAIRAVLVSGIGLLMFGLAGVLWRVAHDETHPEPEPSPAPETRATIGPQADQVGVPVPVPVLEPVTVLDRYEAIRAAVMNGTLKPSVRAIQAVHGGSTTTARHHLNRLHDEGVIQDMGTGRGYALVAKN